MRAGRLMHVLLLAALAGVWIAPLPATAQVVASGSSAVKTVACIDSTANWTTTDQKAFLNNAEGYLRAVGVGAYPADYIQIGGSLTDCLEQVDDNDMLILVVHSVAGGFNWNGEYYTGFGSGQGLMPVPDQFADKSNVFVKWFGCHGRVDPDGGGPQQSLVENLINALGGAANSNSGMGFDALAQARVQFSLTGPNQPVVDQAGIVLQNDLSWQEAPPVNRPGASSDNQQTRAQAILSAQGPGSVTVSIPGALGRSGSGSDFIAGYLAPFNVPQNPPSPVSGQPVCRPVGPDPGLPDGMLVEVQASTNGLADIVVGQASNAAIHIPSFSVGQTASMTVAVTHLNPSQGAAMTLKVLDQSSQVTSCSVSLRPAVTITVTVDSTADADDADLSDTLCQTAAGECTLRAAVSQTNALQGHDTIYLPAGAYPVWRELPIVDSVNLVGASASNTIIDGNNATRIMRIAGPATVAVSGVTLRNGRVNSDGGALLNDGGVVQIDSSAFTGNQAIGGGAILNWGAGSLLTVSGTSFTGNRAGNGGAIENGGGAQLQIDNCTIAGNVADNIGGSIANFGGTLTINGGRLGGPAISDGNSAGDGGALANGGGQPSGGVATLNGVVVAANVVTRAGGALRNYAGNTLSIDASAFTGNRAGQYGGAVHNDGVLTVTDSTFGNNQANAGGAIYNEGQLAIGQTRIGGSDAGGANRAGTGAGIMTGGSGTATLDTVTISGNIATLGGGGIANWGNGTLTLGGSLLNANIARGPDAQHPAGGGGLRNYDAGRVTITASDLVGNMADYGGAVHNSASGAIGVQVDGAGAALAGTSRIMRNTAQAGGAFWNEGMLTIADSTLGGLTTSDANRADGGAGVYNYNGTLTLRAVTIANNAATQNGGGLVNAGAGLSVITNSTLSGNSAVQSGGALVNYDSAVVQIGDSTLAMNSAPLAAAINIIAGRVTVTRSIIAAAPTTGAVCAGTLTSGGNNLATDTSCGWPAVTMSQLGLGVLADNGGPTATHALLPGGRPVDAYTPCVVSFDQRGISRPQNGRCDIGAFELVQQSAVVPAGGSGTVTMAPASAGTAGAAATLTNSGGTPTTLTLASYPVNPTGATVIDAGGQFVDLRVSGADTADSVAAAFYYPTTVVGAAESSLRLLYYNGSGWIAVAGSGGAPPLKNTADNLDGTLSGGRFSVTFDGTSTPRVTQLTGSVFTIAPALDTFDRADGALGGAWYGPEGLGGYQILGRQLHVVGGGPIYWRREAFGVDQEVAITFAAVDPQTPVQAVLLKVQNSRPNWRRGAIEALYDPGAGAVRVSTFQPDRTAWNVYPGIPLTLQAGDRLVVQARADGRVRILRNDLLVGEFMLHAADQAFFNGRGGRIGLCFGAGGVVLDDFGGGTVLP